MSHQETSPQPQLESRNRWGLQREQLCTTVGETMAVQKTLLKLYEPSLEGRQHIRVCLGIHCIICSQICSLQVTQQDHLCPWTHLVRSPSV